MTTTSMIHERYRPNCLEDFLGNPKAVAAVRWQIAHGIGGRAYYISGASGTGKTTLARIMAASIAEDMHIVEYDKAGRITGMDIDALVADMQLMALGKGGRVWILNEAHGLRAPIVRELLGVLERLPAHVSIIFTTTNDGNATLIDGIDGGPLLSRCIPIELTSQGLCPVFAARFAEVARAEGFDVPASKAAALVKEYRNNLRACYSWLGSAESMAYLSAAECAAAVA